MKLNILKYNLLGFIGILFLIVGCTQENYDDYKKFTDGGEISYTEKLDSLKAFSGKNRIKIEGIINADPKINEFRVFWNDGRDSVSVPVQRSQGIDTLEVMINDISENIYNFELRTYDDAGNKSLASNITGRVYGERYEKSLNNRPVISQIIIESELMIDYATMDMSSGVIGSEIVYQNNIGEESTAFIPIDSASVIIDNYLAGSTYTYRTLYVPEEGAIDTFYTDNTQFTPKIVPRLKNAERPFIASTREGRWGILQDWITNDAIKIHNGYGGWDEWNNNIFNIESGWGAPAITNGKIYQVLSFQPGRYILKIELRDTNHELADDGGAYFVIAKGEGLPDVEQLDTADNVLNYERIAVSKGNTYRVQFDVEEETNLSIGQLTTQHGETPGRFANIISFQILPFEE